MVLTQTSLNVSENQKPTGRRNEREDPQRVQASARSGSNRRRRNVSGSPFIWREFLLLAEARAGNGRRARQGCDVWSAAIENGSPISAAWRAPSGHACSQMRSISAAHPCLNPNTLSRLRRGGGERRAAGALAFCTRGQPHFSLENGVRSSRPPPLSGSRIRAVEPRPDSRAAGVGASFNVLRTCGKLNQGQANRVMRANGGSRRSHEETEDRG